MMARGSIIGLLCMVAACGADRAGDGAVLPPGDGAGGGGGAPSVCMAQIVTPTADPIASPTAPVMVSAVITQAAGTLHYQWRVQRDGESLPTTVRTADGSQISFFAPIAGVYDVRLDVIGSLVSCPSVQQAVNVRLVNAGSAPFRIRVVPPIGSPAAPTETTATILGGANRQLGPLVAPLAEPFPLVVRDPAGHGVVSLVRFVASQAALPDTGLANAAFSDALGAVTLRTPSGVSDAIVEPQQPGLASHRFFAIQPAQTLTLSTAALTGTVRDASGGVLAGARLQVTIDGVPSSLATTNASGRFTVFAEAARGQLVTLDVTPPASSGLPRLSATSRALDVGAPLEIAYGPNLTRRDLAGLVVARDGTPLPRARVTVVGSIGAGGTITPVVSGPPVVATGDVALAATTDASGVLPSLVVPAAPLSAVVAAGGADFAVVDLDTTAGAPASLDAPAPRVVPTVITTRDHAGVAGAIVDVLPTGALAKAAAPAVQAIAAAGGNAGQVSVALALGGHYDVRIRDPRGRGALTALVDVAATALPPAITLTPAIELRGSVLFGGLTATPQPLGNAAVEILCATCTGLAADRPLAEGTTDATGRFVLAIPDPDQLPAAPPAARGAR